MRDAVHAPAGVAAYCISLIRREETCHVRDIFRKEMYWQILYTIIR